MCSPLGSFFLIFFQKILVQAQNQCFIPPLCLNFVLNIFHNSYEFENSHRRTLHVYEKNYELKSPKFWSLTCILATNMKFQGLGWVQKINSKL